MTTLRKILIPAGILLWGLSLFLVARPSEPYKPNVPPRPEAATIRITDHKGNVWWTDHINFNDTRSCVVFVALPNGKHTSVCGNYRMEGLQGDEYPASAESI